MLIGEFCGADIDCCRRTTVRPLRSHLHDVVRAAVELGGVTETTITQAARTVREEWS